MRKLAFGVTVLFFTLLLGTFPALACTSFAVYADKPIYGMNFDYNQVTLRFVVEREDVSLFALYFEGYRTVTMNNEGLFMSTQAQYPAMPGGFLRPQHEYLYTYLDLQCQEPDVASVVRNIDGVRLVHYPQGVTLHTLVADADGDAAIIEVGDNENEMVPICGDFIVMTNFKNSDFRDMPYYKVQGTGADRYITAYEFIEDNLENFDINLALETLKKTTQPITLSSMVFDPQENMVYISIDKDFGKIWKVSITDKTIETYAGFDKKVVSKIPKDGLRASDLLAGNYSNYESARTPFPWQPVLIAATAIIVTAATLLFLMRKRREMDI